MFRALGDPARLRLLEYLSQGERCVSELAELAGQEISTISQRLKVLRNERLIERRRQGKHMFYHLADQHVVDLVSSALAHAQEAHH
jgi:ArsR family transcriptional regulator, lead/cadmium/zinc/bismuth-responsive transcriptional repressor